MNIAEALSLLAVYYDDLHVFQWLFLQKLSNRQLKVGKSAYNFLLLSALLNSDVVCKWLVASAKLENREIEHFLDKDSVTREGQNNAHLAASNGHATLTMYLINRVITNKGTGQTFRDYASKSKSRELYE